MHNKRFINALWYENPLLVGLLGLCPAIALTNDIFNSALIGILSFIVLVISEITVSLIRRFIKEKIRIPACFLVITAITSVIWILTSEFFPSVAERLGVFVPLICCNYMIISRTKLFALENGVKNSLIDGLVNGFGFFAAITVIGLFREVVGKGSLFGYSVLFGGMKPIAAVALPAGGMIVLGIFAALMKKIIRTGEAETKDSDEDAEKDMNNTMEFEIDVSDIEEAEEKN